MKKKSVLQSVFGFLHSMKCGILLLLLIAAACTAGSLILQDQIPAYYEVNYGPQMARWILTLQLDRIFTCSWFLLLTVFLCLNLALCSVTRFGVTYRESRRYNLEDRKQKLLTSMKEDAGDVVWDYRCRRRLGLWGPWLCHVGLLLLIAGFALGRQFGLESYIYGVPGETKTLEETGYEITIEDFQIDLREDATVKQYTASLTIREQESGRSVFGTAQVNYPMDAFGMRIYQNSTGWACQVDVYREDVLEETKLLCVGEVLSVESMPDLALVFQKFYPDYAMTDQGAVSISSELKNPCAGFLMYYDGQVIAADTVGIDHAVLAEPYRFVFHDPQPYTLIQVLRDPFQWLAALGGGVILLSLLLCFYWRPEETVTARGKDGRVCGWFHSRQVTRVWEEEAIQGKEEKR